MNKDAQSFGFITIFFVALTCIFFGALIGAVTNMVNGVVSPYYFETVMHWNFPGIWVACIAQGIFEGTVYGVLFALIFTTGFGIITKGLASYSFAFKQLLRITGFVLICWGVGGFLAVLLANISTDLYLEKFPMAPTDTMELIKFAWVGGSIWGAVLGGFISSFLGIVILKISWSKEVPSALA